ncbi:MAG: hypothetical protein HYX68_29620 [Planctomycetes bacterium]|nr:hypothetical protein [Planctomycetota bacterium]
MEKTMIIIRGNPSYGKSAAISFAYEQMIKQMGKACTQVYSQGERRPRKRGSGPPEVWGLILRIDDVLVGFASPGDTPEHLDRCLKPLILRKCLVIVGATRLAPNHPTWERAWELASDNHFEVVPFYKTALQADVHTADWQAACDQANQDWAAKEIVPEIWKAIAKAKLPAEPIVATRN